MFNVVFMLLGLFWLQKSYQNVIISGPGLRPDKIVMPARYFFVNFTTTEHNFKSIAKNLEVTVSGKAGSRECRAWINKLDRQDGTFIIRYKIYETCYDVVINVYFRNKHVGGSPFEFNGLIQADQCYCPEKDFNKWIKSYECPVQYKQITKDLAPFHNIDTNTLIKAVIKKYNQPESTSFCHYVIKKNNLHRKCYGKHVGFNMFADNILLSLARKALLPDMQFIINLGDWPLVRSDSEALPIFSWCGKNETLDIVMPTYDITESTIENMGRVTLDMLSVQGSIEHDWSNRKPQAFWRGRDSREERLKLIDIARKYPDLFNVSLTNFFFYRDKEAEYGPKQPHVSFFKFFDYKYQLNIDGTVAAYRFPYLLAGGSLVLKQDSPFYEHFYSQLREWRHYIPVNRDLSNLVQRVKWALENDKEARRIAKNAQDFANAHLLPQDIFCYHAVLFQKWSEIAKGDINITDDMTHVPQPVSPETCQCANERDEL